MPTVKIELLKGKPIANIIEIRDTVMDALVEVLKLPSNDRNVRIIEYDNGFFEMKEPYEILIEITMFVGRSAITKRKLFQKIVTNLETNSLVHRNKVFIIINEQPLENWGVRGGVPANEIKLDFDIEPNND